MRKTTYFKSVGMLAMTIAVIASLCSVRPVYGAGSGTATVTLMHRESYGSVYWLDAKGNEVPLGPMTNCTFSCAKDITLWARPAVGYVCSSWTWSSLGRLGVAESGGAQNLQNEDPFPCTLPLVNLVKKQGDSLQINGGPSFTARVYRVTLVAWGGTVSTNDFGVAFGSKYGEQLPDGKLPIPQLDGYLFGGWYDNSACDGAAITGDTVYRPEFPSDHPLYAKWTEGTYVLRLFPNGGPGNVIQKPLKYSETYELPPLSQARVGFRFVDWATTPKDSPETIHYAAGEKVALLASSGNFDLYAQWAPITYRYRYDPGRVSGNVTDSWQLDYGEEITLKDPSEFGYVDDSKVFTGWAVGDTIVGMAGAVVSNLTVVADRRVDLTAQWRDKVYELEFDRNNAFAEGEMASVTCKWGKAIPLPANGFKNSLFAFQGWSTNRFVAYTASNEYYVAGRDAVFSNLAEEGTVTFHAVWKDLRDGEIVQATGCTNLVITTADTIDPADSEKIGKRWQVRSGFVLSQNDSLATERSPSALTANIPGRGVLVFEWKYDGDGTVPTGNFVFRHRASDDSHRLISSEWQQERWVYVEDSPCVASWEAMGDAGHMQVRNIRWTPSADAPEAKWFVRYDAAFGFDDGVMTNAEYVVGGPDSSPGVISVIPEREGYRLAGWWTTNYNGEVGGNWLPSEPFVVRKEDAQGYWKPVNPELNDAFCVHPIWEKRTIEAYDVIFDKNAADATGSIEGERWECGKEYQLPSSGFSRPRSTWLGWSDDPEATAAKWELGASVSNLKGAGEKITLYAVWTEPLPPETWELRYDANGGAPSAAMSNLTFEVGASCWVLSVSEGPTRADYNLVGWATDKSASTAQWTPGEKFDRSPQQGEVITLYAVWSTEVYTLVFVGNGATNEMGAAKMSFGGNQKLPISALKRPGYSFCGWAERALDAREGRWNFADGAVLARPLAPLGAVKTLYAAWSNNVYSVHFGSGHETARGTMDPLPCSYDQGGKLPVAAFDDPLFACIGWSRTAGAKTPEYGFGETVLNLAESGMVTLYGVWSNRVDEAIAAASGCSNLVMTASGWSCAEDYLYSNSGLSGDAVLKAEIRGAGTLEFTWAKSMGNVDDFVFLADGLNDSGRRVSGQSEVWISERWVYTNEAARYVAEWRASHGSKLLVKDVKWTPGDALAKWQLRLNVNGGMVVSAMTELDGSYQVVGKSVAELLDKVEPTREPDYDFEGWSLSLNGSPLDNLWQLSPHNNEVLWLYAVWHLRSDVGELAQAVGFNLKLESTVIGDAKPWAVAPEGGWLRSGVIGEGHFFSTLLTYLPSPGKLVFRWRLKSKPTDNTGTGGGFFEGDDHYISDFVLSTDWAIVTYVATSKGKVGWDAIDGGSILEISYIRWYPAKDGEDPETMVIPEYPDDPGGGTGGGGSSTQQGETVSYVDVAGVTHFVTVPNKWLQEYFPGEDKAEMAKRYCRSYVAGTNPTNGTEELKITSMTLDDNGIPSFTWEPDLSDANPPRKYTVYGKEKLEDDWHVPVSVLDRFFTLSVELKP